MIAIDVVASLRIAARTNAERRSLPPSGSAERRCQTTGRFSRRASHAAGISGESLKWTSSNWLRRSVRRKRRTWCGSSASSRANSSQRRPRYVDAQMCVKPATGPGVHARAGLAEELGGRAGRAVDVRLELLLVELADQVRQRRRRTTELAAVVDEEDGRAKAFGQGETAARKRKPMLAPSWDCPFSTSPSPTPPAAPPAPRTSSTRAERARPSLADARRAQGDARRRHPPAQAERRLARGRPRRPGACSTCSASSTSSTPPRSGVARRPVVPLGRRRPAPQPARERTSASPRCPR